jgi:hypothetical protein
MSPKKQPRDSALKLKIIEWIEKLSLHFNSPQDEEQIGIFTRALERNTFRQIDAAFERCLNECMFMPKLADVHQRMPAREMSEDIVSQKTQEMIENMKQIVPNPQTWETEERRGVFYTWFGSRTGPRFLLKARRA